MKGERADQSVITSAAGEVLTGGRLALREEHEGVVAVAALGGVLATAGDDHDGARTARNRVVSSAAVNLGVVEPTTDGVVAGSAEDAYRRHADARRRVLTRRDGVIARASRDDDAGSSREQDVTPAERDRRAEGDELL